MSCPTRWGWPAAPDRPEGWFVGTGLPRSPYFTQMHTNTHIHTHTHAPPLFEIQGGWLAIRRIAYRPPRALIVAEIRYSGGTWLRRPIRKRLASFDAICSSQLRNFFIQVLHREHEDYGSFCTCTAASDTTHFCLAPIFLSITQAPFQYAIGSHVVIYLPVRECDPSMRGLFLRKA